MNATQRLGLIAIVMTLTSCSLPPSQAWRIVKTQGLFPYVSMEFGKRPFPSGVTPLKRGIHLVPGKGTPRTPSSSASLAALTRPSGLGNPYLQANTRQPTPSGVSVTPPKEPTLVTAPKPAPAPAPVLRQRIPATVGAPSPAPAPRRVVTSAPSAPVTKPAPVSRPTPKPAPTPAPSVAKAPEPKPAAPPLPKPAPSNKPVQPPPGSAASSAAAPTLPPAAPAAVPTATAIPGRKGFVNSPFAAKHQIVDVTGLKPGQQVKCPFSGKLFVIPADAVTPPPANP